MTKRARRHADARRSPWRPLAVAAVGAGVLAIAGQGVWAGLYASATSAQSVSSGNLTLTMAATGVGLSQPVSALAPGDTVNRHVVLTNGGTVAGGDVVFSVGGAAGSPLVTDAGTTKGLRIAVNACSVAWNPTAGTCAGTPSVAMSTRALSTLLTTPVTLANVTGTAGAANHLQVSLTLPEQDEVTTNGSAPASSVQASTVALTYTFTAAQRAPRTTNS
jgi:hypothetical protein